MGQRMGQRTRVEPRPDTAGAGRLGTTLGHADEGLGDATFLDELIPVEGTSEAPIAPVA
jgi:hypothetical protein